MSDFVEGEGRASLGEGEGSDCKGGTDAVLGLSGECCEGEGGVW